MAQMVKRLPTLWETRIESLGQEDPLERKMATPVLLSGKSHGQRNPVGYSPWGRKESDTTESLHFTSLTRMKKKMPFTTTLVGLEIIILREVNETTR